MARGRGGSSGARGESAYPLLRMAALFALRSHLIAAAEFHRLTPAGGHIEPETMGAILFSALVGSISFSGSLVAFGKLQELLPGFRRDGADAIILSVGIEDLDNIIQTLGYEIGDEILRESARRLQACLPEALIARGDGFRFLICARQEGVAPLAEVVQRIHAAFQDEQLEVFDSYIIHMDIRIGATEFPALVSEGTQDAAQEP